MHLIFHKQLLHLTLLFLALIIQIIQSSATIDETLSNPIHLSWLEKQSKYDFVFSVHGPLKNEINLESVATNLTSSLASCTGYSACLLQDGSFIKAYNLAPSQPHRIILTSIDKKSIKNKTISSNTTNICDKTTIHIDHYCSTHWHPPVHQYANQCNRVMEWHSPYSCNRNQTNYQRPCYMYDTKSRLIDLTPWILSDGSSYEVDTGIYNKSITNFKLNVCNDVPDGCSPNVASCYVGKQGLVESGFNNLTSLSYNVKDNSVQLTQLGQINNTCPAGRVKTVVKFLCKNRIVKKTQPRLVNSTDCENQIEWETIHACPVSETRVKSTECSIKYEPLGVNINLKQLTGNSTIIKVPNVLSDGKNKTMLMGICQGINKTIYPCEGRASSGTSACLVDNNYADSNSTLTASNSSVVTGSILSSYIRLADDRLYLESFAVNKSCQVALSDHFNATRQLGTRIEFFCSDETWTSPVFLGFEDCLYVFEWASKVMCLEDYNNTTISELVKAKPVPKIQPTIANYTKLSDKHVTSTNTTIKKSAQEMHKDTVKDSQKIISGITSTSLHEPSGYHSQKSENASLVVSDMIKEEPNPSPKKMNNLHKFFMIGLIVMSLGAFLGTILILDRKTQLRIPLSNFRRQARQAFQPQPVPYTRVDDFNDCVDL